MYLKKNKVAEEKKELPNDLIIEIAQRLPAKSVGRFRCVSKEWNSFLSSPEFVKSHPHRSTEHDTIMLINNRDSNRALDVITLAGGDGGGGSSRRLHFPATTLKKIHGCCNGLVLVTTHESSLAVINPVTATFVIIPLDDDDDDNCDMCSLGYNSGDDDYKVVKFKYSDDWVALSSVKIFSLKTMSYKELASCPKLPLPFDCGVYVDGRLYWVSETDNDDCTTYLVRAFNLSTEKFEQVPLPTCLRKLKEFPDIAEIGGCLALVARYMDCYIPEIFHVWIMEKPDSWRKFTIFDDSPDAYMRVICRLGELEFVLLKDEEDPELVAYNCETGVSRNLVIDGLSKQTMLWLSSMVSFRASLVCPNTRFKGQLYQS